MSDLYYANLPEVDNHIAEMRRVDYHIELFRKFLNNAIYNELNKKLELKWEVLEEEAIDEILKHNFYYEQRDNNPKIFQRFSDIEEVIKQFPEIESDLDLYLESKKDELQERNLMWIKIIGDNSISEEWKLIRSLFKSHYVYEDPRYNKRIRIIQKESEFDAVLLETRPKSNIVYLKPNIIPLKRQLEAVEKLKNRPRPFIRPLLKLLDSVRYVNWPYFDLEEVDEWFLLTQENMESIKEQRDFVKKALSTSDFVILEGPPGSGKTFSICELILQLINRKKRILLCASTHVAVDNVLEKLFEGNYEAVIPVRIGDPYNISDKVRDCQIDNIAQFESKRVIKHLNELKNRNPAQEYFLNSLKNDSKNKIIKEFFLNAANLVCGTTIGILSHPYLRFKSKSSETIFDYLIIDEASKTTFQEFLVPAMFAKRWIIVGDPKQLSPYVEQTEVEGNLKGLLDEKDAEICINTFNSLKNSSPYKNPFNFLLIEEDNDIKKKCELQSKALGLRVINVDDNENKIDLLGSQIIIGSPEKLLKLEHYIPMDLEVVIGDTMLFNFSRRCNYWKNNIYANRKYKDENNTWISELSWRLIRDFELRKSKEIKHKYKADIEALLPKWEEFVEQEEDPEEKTENKKKSFLKEKISNRIDLIRRIVFPSVIECLLEGIKKNYKQKVETTLSEGFKERDKEFRYVLLDFQYRMHPEISKFPREMIYEDKALKDSQQINRDWPFENFFGNQRAIWVNVKGRMDKKFRNNELEAEALIKKLLDFKNLTKINPKKGMKLWEVTVLTFYKAQERLLRIKLQRVFKTSNNRYFRKKEWNIIVELCTVDRFQGHEADAIFLSMVQTHGEGFLNSLNRLNVAITRAKYQLVIFGSLKNFNKSYRTKILQDLANRLPHTYLI